jgi:hypothetical protein
MGTIPGGTPAAHIPDLKRPASPHDRDNPRPVAAPGRPYQAVTPQPDPAAARTAAMKSHRESLSAPRKDR